MDKLGERVAAVLFVAVAVVVVALAVLGLIALYRWAL